MHNSHQHGVEIYISMNAYCTILSWVSEFSGFQVSKTSVNKRLFMLCNVRLR